MKKQVLMIAYTGYTYDPRVRKEAETLAGDSEYKVTFLVPKENDQKNTYELEGVIVEELGMSQYSGENKASYLISYFHFLDLAFLNCTRKFFKGEVDIVHVHNMPDILVFAGIIPRIFGKKLILDVHDSMPETYSGKYETKGISFIYWALYFQEKISCALAQKIICVNHTQRDTLVERGIPLEKITVIFNVPDHNRFSINSGIKSKTEKNSFKLVYHGTIEKRTGLDLFIRVVANLADKIPDLQFHIIGRSRGEYARSLSELSENLNIADRVFCNFDGVPLDQIPEVLIQMDCGVIPNRINKATELQLPVKMLEYICLGMPVIASRLRTIEYYFDDDMVSYFEPENIDSMADTVLVMYRDEKRRKKQTKKAMFFLDKYGWEEHHKDLLKLYEQLL